MSLKETITKFANGKPVIGGTIRRAKCTFNKAGIPDCNKPTAAGSQPLHPDKPPVPSRK